MIRTVLTLVLVLFIGSLSRGEDPRAARSVHLGYPTPEVSAFACEVVVRQSTPGSYFMVCGWNRGYFGVQELSKGRKTVLFSVWDSEQNNPGAVADERRVKTVFQGDGVRIGRFGGEGTGGQSFFDFDWKLNEPYRLLVSSRIDNERTVFSGYFFQSERKEWKHLVSFSTLNGGQKLRGLYSFVEDFRRDGASFGQVRRAEYGPAWTRSTEGKWSPVTSARFTGDATQAFNIAAGFAGPRFFLATGGDVKLGDWKLNATMSLPAEIKPEIPSHWPAME